MLDNKQLLSSSPPWDGIGEANSARVHIFDWISWQGGQEKWMDWSDYVDEEEEEIDF